MPRGGRRGSARRAARFACPHPPPGGGRCSTPSRARRFSALPHQVPHVEVAAPLGVPHTHLPAGERTSRGGKAVAGFSGGPLSVAGSQRTLQSVRGGVWPPALRPPLGAPPFPARPHSQQSGQAPPRQSNPSQGGTPSGVQSPHCIQAAGTPSSQGAPLQAEHPRGGRAHPRGGAPRTSRHRHSPPGDLLPGGVRHGRTVSLRGEARPLHPEPPLGPENPSSLPQEVLPMEGTRTPNGRHPIQ